MTADAEGIASSSQASNAERWAARDAMRERHKADMARRAKEERAVLCAVVAKAMRQKPAWSNDAFLLAATAIDALEAHGVVFARMDDPNA